MMAVSFQALLAYWQIFHHQSILAHVQPARVLLLCSFHNLVLLAKIRYLSRGIILVKTFI